MRMPTQRYFNPIQNHDGKNTLFWTIKIFKPKSWFIAQRMHTCLLYAVGPSCCVGHGAHLPNIRAFPFCKYKRPTDKRRTTAFTISSPKAYKMKCRYPVLAAGVKWHSSGIFVTERHRSKLLKLRSLYIRSYTALTHWTRGTYICIGSLTIIGLDNGLSRGLNQCWNIV